MPRNLCTKSYTPSTGNSSEKHKTLGTDPTGLQEDLDLSALAMPSASRRAAISPQGDHRGGKRGGEGKKPRLRGRALTAQLEKDLHRMAHARVKRRYACPKFKAMHDKKKANSQTLAPDSLHSFRV